MSFDPITLAMAKKSLCYDTRTTKEVNFSFGGNLEGYTFYYITPISCLVKVSGLVPTIEEVSKGTVTVKLASNGQVVTQPIGEVVETSDGAYTFLQDQFVVLTEPKEFDTETEIGAPPKYETLDAGIYMVFMPEQPSAFTSVALHIPSVATGELKTIDPKYLPSGGGVEKTMLYDGTPQKLDLSAYGLGTLYFLSTENLLHLAEGQNVYFEYTSNGETVTGCLDLVPNEGIDENGDITTLCGDTKTTTKIVQYNPSLGGFGFGVEGANGALDLGEISLKLWTEYNPSGVYIVRKLPNGKVATVNAEKIAKHLKTGFVVVDEQYYTRLVVKGDDVFTTSTLILETIDGRYKFVDGVYQAE